MKFQSIIKLQVLNFQSKHKVTSPRKHHLYRTIHTRGFNCNKRENNLIHTRTDDDTIRNRSKIIYIPLSSGRENQKPIPALPIQTAENENIKILIKIHDELRPQRLALAYAAQLNQEQCPISHTCSQT